jgi:5-methyltetrahydrofolate--homocysteine methyltransferase
MSRLPGKNNERREVPLLEGYLNAISRAVERGDDKQVVKIVEEALASRVPPLDILEEGLVPGIQALGKLFKDGQVYLPEILISCRAMDRGVEELKPYLADTNIHNKGTVVLGTVQGDLHDIGKKLVRLMLECNGFSVKDLGVDVSADSFAHAARQHSANIVGMSTLLTITMTYMPKVIKALEQARLRHKVKIMIGGAPVTREFADEIAAEGFAEDCVSAVDEAMRLMRL